MRIVVFFIGMVLVSCDPVGFCLPDQIFSGERFSAQQDGVTFIGTWLFQESGSLAIVFDDDALTGSWRTNCLDSLFISGAFGDHAYQIDSIAGGRIYVHNDAGADGGIRIVFTPFKIPD